VRWTSDRHEDLVSTTQAFDEIVDAELALDHDGRILGAVADVIGDSAPIHIYSMTGGIEPVQVVQLLCRVPIVDTIVGRVRAVSTSKVRWDLIEA